MKKVAMVLIMILMFFAGASFAEELETTQMTATLVKVSDSNDAALGVDTTSWAAAQLWREIPKKFNGVKVMFYAYDPTDPNDETFSYELYVADYGNNAQKVAAGTAVVGGAELSHSPISLVELNSGAVDPNYCWVDTLGTITTDWKNSDVLTQNDGGLNDVSSIIFDRQSAKTIWCRIYSRSNGSLVIYCIAYGY